MVLSLSDLARLVDGRLHGDGDLPIRGADIIRDARPGDVTFVDGARSAAKLSSCQATAVLAPPDVQPADFPYITVDDVHQAFARAVAHFRPPCAEGVPGVHPSAVVSPTATLGLDVTVHPLAMIGDDVQIGSGCVIHSGVRILAGCRLGAGVVLFPNVVLYEHTVVGDRTTIHAGAVIGAYGFGYTPVDGQHRRSAQLGYVEIGADVEIGACTTIDRGTYGATAIGDGTKIDNQVMIAHNCRIGRHNLLCSQVGIAGSTTTGDYVVMAGQVGIRDHVHIASGVRLGAKSGVMADMLEAGSYIGAPAVPERQQMCIMAATLKLPEMKKQLRDLQRTVDKLPASQPAVTRQEAA